MKPLAPEPFSSSTRTKPDQPDRELLLRIKNITILKALLLTGFVVMVFTFQSKADFPTPIVPLSQVIGVAYFLFMGYGLLLRFCKNLLLMGAIQTTGDLLVVSGILYATGGIGSPFSFLNILVIIATGTIMPRTACYLAASGAGILYGLLVDLEYYNILHPVYFFPKSPAYHEGGYVFYIIFLNIASYYSVAFLSSMLAHRLKIIKDELEDKSTNLRALQASHENVLRHMGNGLWTTDLEGQIASANPAAEEITGYSASEAQGRLCFEFFPKLKALFTRNVHRPLPFQVEGEYRRKDGKTILMRMKVSRLIEPDGHTQGYICVFEDLTELREMERKIAQSETLAEVGKISAGLAHEVRNPLASLSGSIQVLHKGLELQGNYKRLMEIVLHETERLNTIVSDFLTYSHPGKFRDTAIDLSKMVRDIITLLKNSAEYHPSTRIDFKPSGCCLFQGDEQQVKQMIWNLCINGLQAMANGGTLTIGIRRVKGFSHDAFYSDREGIVLTVRDEGIGIAPDNRNKLFDPFFTTKENGVGLGLAKVYQVVNQNDGYIGVANNPDKGVCFTTFLPLPPVAEPKV
ncbi:MAG: nitrogen regulation protein NR(II) [Nitrospinales bacterium]